MKSRTVAPVVAAAVVAAMLLVAGVGAAGYYLVSRSGQVFSSPMPKAIHVCWPPWNSALPEVSDTAEADISKPQGDQPPPQWERAFDEVAGQVESVRGLKFKEPVRREVMSKDQMAEHMRASAKEDSDKQVFERAEDFLKYVGLIAPELNLADAVGEAYSDQVAGYYDDEAKVLVVRTDLGSPSSEATRSVIAHELVHALDDQHFDLHAVEEKFEQVGRGDEAAAMRALIEGTAMVATLEYVGKVVGVKIPDDAFDQLLEASRESSNDSIPAYIRDQMMFPYFAGGKYVSAAVKAGGWDAVNALYRDPPRSTAEIMHPDRIGAGRWAPDAVRVGAVTETIEGVRDERWFHLGEGVMGEQDLSLLLASAEITNVATAVDGWRGDWHRYVGCVNQRLLTAKFALASEADASELAEALDVWASRWAARDPMSGRAWVVTREGQSVTMVITGDRELAAHVSAI